MTGTEKTIVAIDGTDALAYVILRPGSNASGVVIEAAANGISKPYAAYALRHTAQSWDPDDSVGADVGEQLKEALAEVERLKAALERTAESQTDILIDCATCSQPAHWIDSPTGGWWSHEVHPADGHDASAVEIDLINEIQLLHTENDQLRAELLTTRAAALNEAAADFDRLADQAEAKAAARFPGIGADGACDMLRDAARLLRNRAALIAAEAAPACTCRAEPVHQAGCDTAGGQR